jgi:serine/threonine protein kinase
MKTMLHALDYMHKNKYCHRDLKLENWVYADESEDSTLKLIDFSGGEK